MCPPARTPNYKCVYLSGVQGPVGLHAEQSIFLRVDHFPRGLVHTGSAVLGKILVDNVNFRSRLPGTAREPIDVKASDQANTKRVRRWLAARIFHFHREGGVRKIAGRLGVETVDHLFRT